jgi:hypothetical protein
MEMGTSSVEKIPKASRVLAAVFGLRMAPAEDKKSVCSS